MFKTFVATGMLVASLMCEVEAGSASAEVHPIAWRGGYRYRRNSYSASSRPGSSGASNYGYRSNGRSSALDYPAATQPYSTRINQWNKYPNQPYYLRGERKSLLILP